MTNKVEEIKKNLFINNKLNHYCLNLNWYKKNNKIHILEMIFEVTVFLDSNSSLRERIFYIENNIFEAKLCNFCNLRQLRLNKNKLKFFKSCGNENCMKKPKSQKNNLKNIAKFTAMENWIKNNKEYQFKIIDEDWFKLNKEKIEKHINEKNEHLFKIFKGIVKC